MTEPYPKNVDGPFYIENNCCITCGVPVEIAPELFSWDDDAEHPGHCYVSRQPRGGKEVDLVFEVLRHSEINCLRYRGRKLLMLARLWAQGYSRQCD